MTTDPADAALRLARLSALARSLEADCHRSAEARATCEAIQREIESLRATLSLVENS